MFGPILSLPINFLISLRIYLLLGRVLMKLKAVCPIDLGTLFYPCLWYLVLEGAIYDNGKMYLTKRL